jgi:hypothetical protein
MYAPDHRRPHRHNSTATPTASSLTTPPRTVLSSTQTLEYVIDPSWPLL